MAVREFDGVDDRIDLDATSLDMTGAYTIAHVFKRLVDDGAWHALWGIQTSADAIRGSLSVRPGNNINFGMAAFGHASTTTVVVADGYVIVVGSRAAGNSTLTVSVYKGGAWTHSTSAGTVGNASTANPSGKHRFGIFEASDDPAEIRLAACAIWNGTRMTTTQIEELDGGSIANWAAVSVGAPTEHWEFDQASVATAVEGEYNISDQIAINGTSVAAGDDPGATVYTLTGGAVAAEIPYLVMAPMKGT